VSAVASGHDSVSDCKQPGDCDFEYTSSCGWTEAGKMMWTHGTKTPSVGTGAEQPHSGKHFMFLETSTGVAGDKSYLISPKLQPGMKSMTFFYHMHGKTMGTMTVEATTNGQTWTPVWIKMGQQHSGQKDKWMAAGVALPPGTIYVRLGGTRGASWQGDMAVDTVSFSSASARPCPIGQSGYGSSCTDCPAGTYGTSTGCIVCGLGKYSTGTRQTSATACQSCPAGLVTTSKVAVMHDSVSDCKQPGDCDFEYPSSCGWRTGGKRMWFRGTKTPSAATGAEQPHSGTHFLFLETSQGKNNDKSYLISPKLNPGMKTMSFFYHMHGKTMGTMTVEATTNGQTWTPVWTKTGQQHSGQKDKWMGTGVALPPGTIQVRISGTKGTSWQGDMAVDTVSFSSASARPCPIGQSGYGSSCTDCPAGTYGTSRGCIVCGLNKYSTGTRQTSATACQSCPIGTTTLSAVASGHDSISDCSSPGSCEFEKRTICGWTEAGKMMWTRGTRTPSVGTGAEQPHSGKHFMFLETSRGTYGDRSYLLSPKLAPGVRTMSFFYHMHGKTMGTMTVEAKQRGQNKWTVLWQKTGQQHSGQKDQWMSSGVALPPGTMQVRIAGSKGASFTGDMAIDTVKFLSAPPRTCPAGQSGYGSSCTDCPAGTYRAANSVGQCKVCPKGKYSTKIKQTKMSSCQKCPVGTTTLSNLASSHDKASDCGKLGSCDFERKNICGWTAGGKRKWTRGTKTPSSYTGAEQPHSGTHFIFLETSAGRKNDKSYLISPQLQSDSRSMTFFYHMHGKTMGTMTVEAKVKGQKKWIVLWTKTGQQHSGQKDKWMSAGVKLPAGVSTVRFGGTRGTSWQGDMAIDTVAVSQMPLSSSGGQSNGGGTAVVPRPCPSGQLWTGTGCSGCPPGSYLAKVSASLRCSVCPVGRYSSKPGLASVSACMACPKGTTTLSPAAIYHDSISDCRVGVLGSCDFEAPSICGWTEAGNKMWKIGTKTPSVGTGAEQPHTGKHFMYLETSSGAVGDKSYLVSPKLQLGTQSISFYYHMHGKTMGTMAVETLGAASISSAEYIRVSAASNVGSKSGSWDLYEVACTDMVGRKMKLLVDEVSHYSGTPQKHHRKFLTDGNPMTYWAANPNVCGGAKLLGGCQWVTFKLPARASQMQCTVTQAAKDKRWAVTKVAIEASLDKKAWTVPKIESVHLGANKFTVRTAGQVWAPTTWKLTGEQHSGQKDQWMGTALALPQGTTHVRIVGSKGKSFTGDMAVDTVKFSTAAYVGTVCTCFKGTAAVGPTCQFNGANRCASCTDGYYVDKKFQCVKANPTCGFDMNDKICGWTHAGQKRWEWGKKTASTGTGAEFPHSGTHFMFLETSFGSFGDKSYLLSPKLPVGMQSMSFFYHMHGKTMGTMTVEATTNGQTWTPVWTKTGQQHSGQKDKWMGTGVALPPGTIQVRISGTKGTSWQGDMAVDTVSFSSASARPCPIGQSGYGSSCTDCPAGTYGTSRGCIVCGLNKYSTGTRQTSATACQSCPIGTTTLSAVASGHDSISDCSSPGSCEFEKRTICGWTEAGKMMWTHGTKTPSVGTGAEQPHSGKHFMFLETSTGRKNDRSYLISPKLQPGMKSISFFYHMHGKTMGTMTVEATTNGQTWTTLWRKTGQQHSIQGDRWVNGDIGLPTGTVQVRVSGSKGASWQGDMAIDTVSFSRHAPKTLTVELKLAATISALAPGSPARQKFDKDLRRDVATVLSVSADRIAIVAVVAGSVVVRFNVEPDASGHAVSTSAASAAFGTPGRTFAGYTSLSASWRGQLPSSVVIAAPPSPPPLTPSCSPGTGLSADGSCSPCSGPNFSNSGVCKRCLSGTKPNQQHTACGPCPSTMAGTDGFCMQCPDGTKPDAASVSCQAVGGGSGGGGGGGGGDGGFAFLELIIGIVIGVGVALLLFRTFGSRQQIGVDSTQPQAQAPKPAAPPPSSAASSPSSFQQPVAVQQVAPPPTMTSVNPLQNSIEAESSIADPAQFLRGRRLAAATAAVDDEDV
jgi:hypothetical protein